MRGVSCMSNLIRHQKVLHASTTQTESQDKDHKRATIDSSEPALHSVGDASGGVNGLEFRLSSLQTNTHLLMHSSSDQ